MTLIGTSIGKIRIVDEIGKGGMGEVFLGFDEKLKRKVALKVIRGKQRLDTKAKARFKREAQVLSQLEHPNICRIYDFIEHNGKDTLIMEYLQGRNLKKALSKGLSFSEKLKIAEQIVKVLVVTHEKGIIHRDLKPENIILTDQNQIKVLDFGLSCFASDNFYTEEITGIYNRSKFNLSKDQSNSDSVIENQTKDISSDIVDNSEKTPDEIKSFIKESITEAGTVVGTPMFMSPEQAKRKPLNASTDMFSFGLLLQWLFTEKLPYPSNLSLLELFEYSLHGKSLPIKDIDADLTKLINRLKHIDPEIRPNAEDTKQQILWIIDKPKRRIRRFTYALIVTILLIGTILSTIGFVNATLSKKETQAALKRIESVNEFLKEMLVSTNPYQKGIHDIKMIDVLDNATKKINKSFKDHPLDKAEIFYILGETYYGLGDYKKSLKYTKKSFEIRKELLGEKNGKTLHSQHNLGLVFWAMGDYKNAKIVYEDVIKKRKEILGTTHLTTLTSLNNLGLIYYSLGNRNKAEKAFFEVAEQKKIILGKNHPETLTSYHNLAVVFSKQGKVKKAEKTLLETMERRRRVLGDDHPETLISRSKLAEVIMAQNRLDEAEKMFVELLKQQKKRLGENHPDISYTLKYLATTLEKMGKIKDAVFYYREAAKLGDNNMKQEIKNSLIRLNSK